MPEAAKAMPPPEGLDIDDGMMPVEVMEDAMADAFQDFRSDVGSEHFGGQRLAEVNSHLPVDEDIQSLTAEIERLRHALDEKDRELGNAVKEKRALKAAAIHASPKVSSPVSQVARLESELRQLKQDIQAAVKEKEVVERNLRAERQAHTMTERLLTDVRRQVSNAGTVESRLSNLREKLQQLEEENRSLKRSDIFKSKELSKLQARLEKAEDAAADLTQANRAAEATKAMTAAKTEKRHLEADLSRMNTLLARAALRDHEEDGVMPIREWHEERRVLQAKIKGLEEKLSVAEKSIKNEQQVSQRLRQRMLIFEQSPLTSTPTSTAAGRRSGSGTPINSYTPTTPGSRRAGTHTSGPRSSSPGPGPRSRLGQSPAPRGDSAARSTAGSRGVRGSSLANSSAGGSVTSIPTLAGVSSALPPDGENDSVEAAATSGLEPVEVAEGETSAAAAAAAEAEAADGALDAGAHEDGLEDGAAETQTLDYSGQDDLVPATLLDLVQKEVMKLRGIILEQHDIAAEKDSELDTLARKVETLTKAKETEAKKWKAELAQATKEMTSARMQVLDKDRDYREREETLKKEVLMAKRRLQAAGSAPAGS